MALIPPAYLDAVVAIGVPAEKGTRRWMASGFLYGDFAGKVTETERKYRVYLVTNRHVLEGVDVAYVRFNPEGAEPAREYNLPLQQSTGTRVWFPHPNPDVDVAIIPINAKLLADHQIKFHVFESDSQVAERARAREIGVSEGDGVFILGFPMGIVGGERNFVIVRQGIVARIKDALEGLSHEFLLDASIFPGNSGGPVVLRPEATAIQGTTAQTHAYLIGVVTGYVPYRDVAISAQTSRTRVVFEENSGLAAAAPIDFVKEAIGEHLKNSGGA